MASKFYIPFLALSHKESNLVVVDVEAVDSPAPGTLRRQIIEKEDISLTGIACYSLSQLKLLSMTLEL